MNITFFIGNGFDLNLGLKTSYQDFYKFFIKKSPDNIIAKEISKNYELWSDLEIGLGKITSKFSINQKEEFLDNKDELERILIEYLNLQNSYFGITDEAKLALQFKSKIVNISKEFNPKEKRHFEKMIGRKEQLNYQIIDFNYTNILDSIVNITRKHINPFSSRTINGYRYNDALINPIHIHGTVNENMILGVNDYTQIENEEFRFDFDIINYLVKPQLNENIGFFNSMEAQNVISESIYICVYGMSIGDTDKVWWISVIQWLLANSDRRLVLFTKDDSVVAQSAAAQTRHARKKKDKIVNYGLKLSPDEQQRIINQTIIVNNSDIFDFEGYKIKTLKEKLADEYIKDLSELSDY